MHECLNVLFDCFRREALNLLDHMPKNVEYLLALCAKCQGTPAEINELHEKVKQILTHPPPVCAQLHIRLRRSSSSEE